MIMVIVIESIPYSHLMSFASIKISFTLNFVSEMGITLNCSASLPMSRALFVVLDDMGFQIPAGTRNFFSKTGWCWVHPASCSVGTVRLIHRRKSSWEMQLLLESN
jgi:hypothetical protein